MRFYCFIYLFESKPNVGHIGHTTYRKWLNLLHFSAKTGKFSFSFRKTLEPGYFEAEPASPSPHFSTAGNFWDERNWELISRVRNTLLLPGSQDTSQRERES
jgi:hypothetical protein